LISKHFDFLHCWKTEKDIQATFYPFHEDERIIERIVRMKDEMDTLADIARRSERFNTRLESRRRGCCSRAAYGTHQERSNCMFSKEKFQSRQCCSAPGPGPPAALSPRRPTREDYPSKAGPPHCAVHAGRRHRYHRAPDREKTRREVGPAGVVDNRTVRRSVGVELTSEPIRTATPSGLISASHSVNPRSTRSCPTTSRKTCRHHAGHVAVLRGVHQSLGAGEVDQGTHCLRQDESGKLNFGSSGTARLQHFAGRDVQPLWQTSKITHSAVPGWPPRSSPSAGEIQVGYGTLFGVRPALEDGRLRVLAITRESRSPPRPSCRQSLKPACRLRSRQWYGIIPGRKCRAQ